MAEKKTSPAKKRTRAHSDEEKMLVREAIVQAGRQLCASKEYAQVSLRSVAAHAGYSAGTIYQYFADQRDLLMTIREKDMSDAVSEFERIAEIGRDPEVTVKNLFIGVALYWSKHFDHYHILFSAPPWQDRLRNKKGIPFGKSKVVLRSYSLYRKVTKAFLDTLPCYPLPLKTATDTLIAVTHGTVSFPMYTSTLKWGDQIDIVRGAIEALITHWKIEAQKKKEDS